MSRHRRMVPYGIRKWDGVLERKRGRVTARQRLTPQEIREWEVDPRGERFERQWDEVTEEFLIGGVSSVCLEGRPRPEV